MSDAPSGYRIEQALAAWMSARSRLLSDDAELAHDEAALTELLGPEEGEIDAILARLLRAARYAKSMSDGAAELIEEMQARKARYTRRNEALRATAFAIMDALGKKKTELPDITASVRAGQPSVVVVDEEVVPEIYIRTERKIDKATVLSALKSGLTVEGCVLSNSLPTLSIRSR